jgi:hypothetical protein
VALVGGSRPVVGLERETIAELRDLFERHKVDVGVLELLSKELKRRPGDAAFDLLLRVAPALVAARKNPQEASRHCVQEVLSARGLQRPDGRSLYRYRLSLVEWEGIREYLTAQARRGALDRADERDAGLFALYAAEWFRREFEGGSYRWDELLTSIGGLSQETTADLARRGLKWWSRKAYQTEHGEQRLMSLALEGGFPTRLLESRERGWLSGALRRLIARASVLADQSIDAIVEVVRDDATIPSTFRKEEFFLLLAELAASIVLLRHEAGAEATAAGIPTSAWLDARKEGWRNELPISLEGAGASKLIDELISQSLERLGGAGARCWRLLRQDRGGWSPALRMSVDGETRVPADVRALQSRLRVYACGALGDFIAGEIALLDPPGEDGAWVARPRPAAPRSPLLNFPFSAPVEVELRVDGQRVSTVVWSPSGEPVHGEVLAFVDEQENSDSDPVELSLVGTGSQRTKRNSIYAWTPASYTARTFEGVDVPCIWGDERHRLFRLDSKSYVGEAGDELSFCLEPNADSDVIERIILIGNESQSVYSTRGDRVFLGAPSITLKSGATTKPMNFSEVYWRRVGEQTWRDIRRERLTEGVVEIVWRSAESRVARDRRRIVVLPASLILRRRGHQNGLADFWLEGGADWRLLPAPSAYFSAEVTDRGFQAGWEVHCQRKIPICLVSGDHKVDLETMFPLGDGALVSAEGVVFKNNETVKLSRLRGARAVADRPSNLTVETMKGKQRSVYYKNVTDECSLWSVRDRIAGLMETSGELDCEVRVGFEPNGPYLLVKRYEYDVNVLGDRIALMQPPRSHGGELSFRWRSLIDMTPRGRRVIATLSVADAMSCRPVLLPDDLDGPGIVHLCEGEDIASRSRFVPGRALDASRLSPLQSAVLMDGESRFQALRSAFEAIEQEAPEAVNGLQWLHSLLEQNSEIPATTFDVLLHLGRRSLALAHLVASSSDEESLMRAWGLESELPFLWVLTGVADWQAAFLGQCRRTTVALMQIGWTAEQAASTAAEQVSVTVAGLISLDENLRAPLAAAGLCEADTSPQKSPKVIGQDRIRRLAGSEQEGRRGSCFMSDEELGPALLNMREWYEGFHQEHWEGLQAPLVAALRASGRAKLLPLHRLRIREAINDDPEHFTDAYSAAIRQLAGAPNPMKAP